MGPAISLLRYLECLGEHGREFDQKPAVEWQKLNLDSTSRSNNGPAPIEEQVIQICHVLLGYTKFTVWFVEQNPQ